jgi:ATP-dependent protease ClpP protease subunit
MSINIFGVVGEDVRAADVLKQIQAEKGDTIEVTIMSCGGSVVEGLAIYDALRASGKKIKTSALGMAASIASIIFMAGDEREVSDNAEIMVHNASVVTGGNKHTLKDAIETLDGMDNKLIEIYASRTGLGVDELTELLNKETFMSADEAVSKGFATIKTDALALVAIHNKTKEPLNMAEKEEEVTKGMFKKFMAWLNSEVKAEDIPEKEDDAAEEAKAEEPMEEEPEAMEEKPDLEAENIALKAELEEMKAKAMEEDEEVKAKAEEVEEEKKEEEAKALLVFSAMTDNKVTMKEAKNLLVKPLDFVNETLKDRAANATGLGKAEAPKKEAINSLYDEYKAIDDAGQRQAFFVKNKEAIINQSKES